MSDINASRVSGAVNSSTVIERARIAAIVNSPEGKARPEAAIKLALHNDIGAQNAIELLRTFPAENPYLRAMDVHGPSGINATPGTAPPAGSKDARMAEIQTSMSRFNQVKGYTRGK